MTLLRLAALRVRYGATAVLDGVDLEVAPGEIVGLVGESGSGKSTLALATLGLLPASAEMEGTVEIAGRNLATLDERRRDALRGGIVGAVFQDSLAALDPAMTIGAQVAETVRLHTGLRGRAVRAAAGAVLADVGLGAVPPARYPHQLSGGQRQRVGIAAAIAAGPRLLIADEPTAALDVTAQAAIAALLRRLVRERDMGLLLVSHDLALIAALADRVAVLHAGRIVETGPAAALLERPRHDYTRTLVASARHVPPRRAAAQPTPLLEVAGLTCRYPGARKGLRQAASAVAVDDAGFAVAAGETVGVVGESGAGKSTLVRAVLGLARPHAGTVRLLDTAPDLHGMQAVFQDPAASFDPRWRVGRIVAEPLHRWHLDQATREARVEEAVTRVGLPSAVIDAHPHHLSGGQRQRVAIARALVVHPALVVLDEAVSALDATTRAGILDLLTGLSDRLGIAYLFVSHDLAMLRRFAHRLIVMQDGRVVEQGPTAELVSAPRHPYTAALLAATPDLDALIQKRGG